MKPQTESVLMSICAADETISKADISAALAVLRGRKGEPPQECDTPLTRREAAELLRVSRTTVTAWAKRGTIRRIAIKGRRKALGYSRKSVLAILNGQ